MTQKDVSDMIDDTVSLNGPMSTMTWSEIADLTENTGEEDDEDDDEPNDGEQSMTKSTILKVDDDRRMVWGWASVATIGKVLVEDHQQDVITADDLQETAHDFMMNHRVNARMHKRRSDDHEVTQTGAVVDSVMFTKDLQDALGIDLGMEAWLVGVKVTDEDTWAAVKSGELRAFSIGGSAERVPLEKGQPAMQDVHQGGVGTKGLYRAGFRGKKKKKGTVECTTKFLSFDEALDEVQKYNHNHSNHGMFSSGSGMTTPAGGGVNNRSTPAGAATAHANHLGGEALYTKSPADHTAAVAAHKDAAKAHLSAAKNASPTDAAAHGSEAARHVRAAEIHRKAAGGDSGMTAKDHHNSLVAAGADPEEAALFRSDMKAGLKTPSKDTPAENFKNAFTSAMDEAFQNSMVEPGDAVYTAAMAYAKHLQSTSSTTKKSLTFEEALEVEKYNHSHGKDGRFSSGSGGGGSAKGADATEAAHIAGEKAAQAKYKTFHEQVAFTTGAQPGPREPKAVVLGDLETHGYYGKDLADAKAAYEAGVEFRRAGRPAPQKSGLMGGEGLAGAEALKPGDAERIARLDAKNAYKAKATSLAREAVKNGADPADVREFAKTMKSIAQAKTAGMKTDFNDALSQSLDESYGNMGTHADYHDHLVKLGKHVWNYHSKKK